MQAISLEQMRHNARRLLENPFWPTELKSDVGYRRLHDDNDGTGEGVISVFFEPNTVDAFVEIDIHHGPPLRFRTQAGGGMSPRVYNALVLLAEAIRLDNKDKPVGDPERHS